MNRREIAAWIVLASIAAAAVAAIAFGPLTRPPSFHLYADRRTWLDIPNAGDVLSNLAFVVVGMTLLQRAMIQGVSCAPAASLAVVGIGIGSTLYHWAPSDTTLMLDWGSIAIALMLVLAAVVRDRIGGKLGAWAPYLGVAAAAGVVAWWRLGGGTTGGGNMVPYVAVQAMGVLLPLIVALAAPGRVQAGWLALAVVAFTLARVCARYDVELLDAIGLSGHSAKHLVAALAAGFALRALTPPGPDD